MPDKQEVRPIRVIAREISADWQKVYFGAEPYLREMHRLDTIDQMVGHDSAKEVVTRFVINAGTWRGETARRVKAELKRMAGMK